MKKLRVYLDTSVFGGCLDEEFASDSLRVFTAAKEGLLLLLISEIVLRELEEAPSAVKDVLNDLTPGSVEVVTINEEILGLRDSYIQAGVVGQASIDDAGHVAAATVAHADAILSWNFRHVVRLDKIRGYNQVNLMNGYGVMTILTPREADFNEQEDR
jgi:hypothetical protein